MQLNPALAHSQYDFIWLPTEPDQSGEDDEQVNVRSDALPLAKVGNSGRSPVWEGRPYTEIELPTDALSSRSVSPVRDCTCAYPDRYEALICTTCGLASPDVDCTRA